MSDKVAGRPFAANLACGWLVRVLKLLCSCLCLAIVLSNGWSMTRWTERRGISDDLCYLRQAHLFRQYGLAGLSTDIGTDTSGHFRRMVEDVGQPGWHSADYTICHSDIARTGRRVMQYPPGTGALLALFPEGHQVVPLYVAANLLILALATLAIAMARSRAMVAAATAFGAMALYFMINPAKASFSMAPTLVISAWAGWLTAHFFQCAPGRRWRVIAALGLLLGASVNVRIPNLLLLTSYGVFFLTSWAVHRSRTACAEGAVLALTGLVGLTPTLAANAINAGSPLATTYGGQDVAPPDFTFSITRAYLADPQAALIIAAIAGTLLLLVVPQNRPHRPLGALLAIDLAVNLGYFLSHPVFTQYYLMPVAMLSLWTLLFAAVLDDRRRPGGPSTSLATPACASRQKP